MVEDHGSDNGVGIAMNIFAKGIVRIRSRIVIKIPRMRVVYEDHDCPIRMTRMRVYYQSRSFLEPPPPCRRGRKTGC